MNTSKLITVASRLKKSLQKQAITRLGREVGFTQRLREVTPHRLAVTLVSAMAAQRVETIADILRAFNCLTGSSVQYKPFHNQLSKSELPAFMKGVFTSQLEELAVREVVRHLIGAVEAGDVGIRGAEDGPSLRSFAFVFRIAGKARTIF